MADNTKSSNSIAHFMVSLLTKQLDSGYCRCTVLIIEFIVPKFEDGSCLVEACITGYDIGGHIIFHILDDIIT